MAVIELVRKAQGGRSTTIGSDLRVYATRETDKKGRSRRYSVGLRVSGETMKRLRWIIGDHVKAVFDDAVKTWTVRRVSAKEGNALSGQGRNSGCGTVRFAVDESALSVFGLVGGEGYDAELLSDEGDCAVFAVK